MTRRYCLTARAGSDIREIVSRVAADNPAAATRVKVALFDAFQQLVDNPQSGQQREDLTTKPVRFWPVFWQNYMIVYDARISPLTVLRVFGAARDLTSVLL